MLFTFCPQVTIVPSGFSNFGELMIRVPPKKDQQKIAGILLEIDNFLKKIIKDIECTQNLRKGFIEIAQNDPNRCYIVDGSAEIDNVRENILKKTEQHFGL